MKEKELPQEVKNIPYNAKFMDEFKKAYVSQYPNRQERRKKEPRFKGNSKGNHITIVQGSELGGTRKYFRVTQRILCKDGSVKTINHYR